MPGLHEYVSMRAQVPTIDSTGTWRHRPSLFREMFTAKLENSIRLLRFGSAVPVRISITFGIRARHRKSFSQQRLFAQQQK